MHVFLFSSCTPPLATWQAAAFAGDAAAARRLPAALASLEEQLSALEAAVEQMHRAPGKFGLVSDDIVERRAQVEALRLDASDVARVCEGIGIRAAAGPSGDGGSGGGDDAFSSFQDVDLGGGRRQGERGLHVGAAPAANVRSCQRSCQQQRASGVVQGQASKSSKLHRLLLAWRWYVFSRPPSLL